MNDENVILFVSYLLYDHTDVETIDIFLSNSLVYYTLTLLV